MQFPKCDLHTHTKFCDGADTPEEMVLAAIGRGMNTLGFSGHSRTKLNESWCMSEKENAQYRTEIAALREKYAGRIRILCGIEQDFYSTEPAIGYDYVIGSVHYLVKDGEYFAVDESRESFLTGVREYFGGDFYRMIRLYYETVAQVAEKTGCDIIGHFDLVEKFNRGGSLFSPDDLRYRRAALDALDVLLERDLIFEINTGAIARGYRDIPYPSAYLLRRIAEKRGRVMLNSDSHRKEGLMFAFEDAARFARSCGIGGFTVPDASGTWRTIPIGRAE